MQVMDGHANCTARPTYHTSLTPLHTQCTQRYWLGSSLSSEPRGLAGLSVTSHAGVLTRSKISESLLHGLSLPWHGLPGSHRAPEHRDQRRSPLKFSSPAAPETHTTPHHTTHPTQPRIIGGSPVYDRLLRTAPSAEGAGLKSVLVAAARQPLQAPEAATLASVIAASLSPRGGTSGSRKRSASPTAASGHCVEETCPADASRGPTAS